jgi:hypothetical protein
MALTVIWLGVVLYFVMWRSAERFELWDLTNLVVLGFTPPVLLWLIRAVLRQSRTLRMIEGQLHLQIQELQRMVVQQKRMVEDLRSQKRKMVADLEAQRAKELQASRPLLQMKIIGIGGTVDDRNLVHFVLLNHGRTCTDVLLSFNGGHASQEFLRIFPGICRAHATSARWKLGTG